MTVAYWQGRQWRWGVASGASAVDVEWHGRAREMAEQNAKPLDDRLGTEGPRWAVLVSYIDSDGEITTEKTEVHVREQAPSYRMVHGTPDQVVELEAGRLARNVMRKRGNKRA